MGARREGDVRLLCDVARPDAVVVTNVGTAHLDLRVVGRDRPRGAEPVEWLGADGTAIVNADDPVTRAYADKSDAALITFGLDPGADVRAEDVELGPDGASDVHPPLGRRTRAGRARGPRRPHGVERLAGGRRRRGRREARRIRDGAQGRGRRALADGDLTGTSGIVIVNDAYNANPESMAAALKSARWMARGQRLVAVLGHMAELGPIAFEEHEKLGRLVVRIGVERLITVGEQARTIARAAIREGQLPEDVASYQDPSRPPPTFGHGRGPATSYS